MKKKDQSLHSTSLLTKFKDIKKFPYRKRDAVKYLESLANEAARMKYPNVPYLAPREFRDDTENSLYKCIIAFLNLKGHFCERSGNEGKIINNRKKFTDVVGNERMIGNIQLIYGTGKKITKALKAVIQDRLVIIEINCSATQDRQSELTELYQEEVEKSRGIYLLVPDFETFLTWYQKFTS